MRVISWLWRERGTTIQEDYNPQTLLTHQKERRQIKTYKYKTNWIKYVAFETVMNTVVFVMVKKLSKWVFLQLQELWWSGLVFIQTKRFHFFSLCNMKVILKWSWNYYFFLLYFFEMPILNRFYCFSLLPDPNVQS